MRIKRLVITPLRGVIPPPFGGGNKGAGKPKADRATTKKKISCPFAMPYSDGAVSPIRSGPSVPKKKKKELKGNGQKLKTNQLNVRLNSGQKCASKFWPKL